MVVGRGEKRKRWYTKKEVFPLTASFYIEVIAAVGKERNSFLFPQEQRTNKV